MANPQWPPADKRSLIGKRISRVDGAAKVTGAAKYTHDINPPGLLYAKVVTSPHAAAKIKGVDTSAAERTKGVRAVWIDEKLTQVQYYGQIVAALAADTEEIATEAALLIKVNYEPEDHQVVDSDRQFASGRARERENGDVAAAFAKADFIVEGEYGIPTITHCCLESHGQVADFRDGELKLWGSTQNVTRYADRMENTVGVPQNKIHVECQYIGGGFGSKFAHDKWGMIGAILSKKAGKPVKLMLERDIELMVAGNRPSAFAKIKVGVSKKGEILAVDSEAWGSGGRGGFRAPTIPYVFTKVANRKTWSQGVRTHRGSQRAWRAPSHPQAAFLTMSALEDAAAAAGVDALEFFKLNLDKTGRPQVYREELDIAADLIGYKEKAHLRSAPTKGPVKRGLGLSMHTWGGRGHPSECEVTINPDGSVEVKIGSQDLGTGTRTVIAIVVAETLGLPLAAVEVKLGRNDYPPSGGSGGSTTVGGVSASSRLAATAALNSLLEVAASKLGVEADTLEAREGRIRQTSNPSTGLSWEEACGLLGPNMITERGVNNVGESQRMGLLNSGVGGVQMADVSVDVETGVVTLIEMVAVQDCGLIIDLKLAESQVYGALIMGITWALFEECVYDPITGRMLNADMEFYRLAGLKDVGKLKVHMMTGEGYDERGVIGLGEPPAISPGAAIANAVANACGVRVPFLPLTPERVIDALQKGGTA